MATNIEFIEFVYEQIKNAGNVRYKKMFGEYMVYVNEKPIFLVCDDIVYVKMLNEIKDYMKDSSKGVPYKGAKEHYILDIDDKELVFKMIEILEPIIALPKPRNKKLK